MCKFSNKFKKLYFWPIFGAKKCFPKTPTVTHNTTWTSNTMLNFRKSQSHYHFCRLPETSICWSHLSGKQVIDRTYITNRMCKFIQGNNPTIWSHVLRARIHRTGQRKFCKSIQKHHWEGEKEKKSNGDCKALRIKTQTEKLA